MAQKILLIPSWYVDENRSNGGLYLVHQQAKMLIERGFEAGVMYADLNLFSPLRRQVKFNIEDGVPTIRSRQFFPPRKHAYLYRVWAKQFKKLYPLYREKIGVPDIIHAHGYLAGYVANLIKKEEEIPYVLTEHSSDFLQGTIPNRRRKVLQTSLDHATTIISVSEGLAKSIVPYTSNRRIITIPNSIDTQIFNYKDKQAEFDKKDSFTFLSIGSPVYEKGLDILLKAFALVQKKANRKCQLLLGDDIKGKKILRDLADRLIITDIIYLGDLSREKVRNAYVQADVYISASRIETFGMTIAEALSCGTPVVATQTIGANYIMKNFCGKIIPKESEEELASAMLYMMEHIKEYDFRKIRSYILNTFGQDVVIERIIEVYNRAISADDL